MAIYPNAAYYVQFIDSVFQGSVSATIYDITEDVVCVCNTVYLEIQTCSRRLFGVDVFYNIFWTASDIWTLVANLVIGGLTGGITDWIAYLNGYTQYTTCVLAAAVRWKTEMTLALVGLARSANEEVADYLKKNAKAGPGNDKTVQEIMNNLKAALAVVRPEKVEVVMPTE